MRSKHFLLLCRLTLPVHNYNSNFLCRSAVSRSRAFKIATSSVNSETESLNELPEQNVSAQAGPEIKKQDILQQANLRAPWRDWLRPPWLKPQCKTDKVDDSRF